jgi:hypothetical protein
MDKFKRTLNEGVVALCPPGSDTNHLGTQELEAGLLRPHKTNQLVRYKSLEERLHKIRNFEMKLEEKQVNITIRQVQLTACQ